MGYRFLYSFNGDCHTGENSKFSLAVGIRHTYQNNLGLSARLGLHIVFERGQKRDRTVYNEQFCVDGHHLSRWKLAEFEQGRIGASMSSVTLFHDATRLRRARWPPHQVDFAH
jgi:hypothetical protein